MALATAYSNLMYDSKPMRFEGNDYIEKIVQVRNQKFEEAYQQIENFKNQSLSLGILNEEVNGKVDAYNQEINKFFSGKDLTKMDLASNNIASKYLGVFDKIGNDQELVIHKKKSDEIRQTMQTYKQGKLNPLKSGYSSVNESVFFHETINPYVKGSSKDAMQVQDVGFLPYYDYTTELTRLKGQVEYDGQKFTVKKLDKDGKPTGETTLISKKEKSPEKLKQLFSSGLSPQALHQIQLEGKANFYQSYDLLPPDKQAQAGRDIQSQFVQSYQSSLDFEKERLEYTKGLASTSGKDYSKEITELENSIVANTQQINEIKSIPFETFDKLKLGQYAGGLYQSTKLDMLSKGFSSVLQETVDGVDQVYMKNRDYGLDVAREQRMSTQAQFDMQSRARKQAFDEKTTMMDLEIKASKPNGSIGKTDNTVIGKVEGERTSLYKLDNLVREMSQAEQITKATLTPDEQGIRVIMNKDKESLNPIEAVVYNYVSSQKGDINQSTVGAVHGLLAKDEVKSIQATAKATLSNLKKIQEKAYNQTMITSGLTSENEVQTFRNTSQENNQRFLTAWDKTVQSMTDIAVANTKIINLTENNRNVVANMLDINIDPNKITKITSDGVITKVTYEVKNGDTTDFDTKEIKGVNPFNLQQVPPTDMMFQVTNESERVINNHTVYLFKQTDNKIGFSIRDSFGNEILNSSTLNTAFDTDSAEQAFSMIPAILETLKK